jgi:hypothetical protein
VRRFERISGRAKDEALNCVVYAMAARSAISTQRDALGLTVLISSTGSPLVILQRRAVLMVGQRGGRQVGLERSRTIQNVCGS